MQDGSVVEMETTHRVLFESAAQIAPLEDGSVDLIVTSPPYPMIEMWDDVFAGQDPAIRSSLTAHDGTRAYLQMHEILDSVWAECARVLRPGGFMCINIGDATRKLGDNFRLYTNHSRITQACEAMGLQSLPPVIWRKQTNAPNKFMGSGMLPSGAYVTLEHEYILIFRKGGKRTFAPNERERRRKSAFFWEERNQWFSDLWDFKGVRQHLGADTARARSGAFPFELAFRLIQMYSLQGDTVLDPFIGTGTTLAAAMASARSSVGVEIDETFADTIESTVQAVLPVVNDRQIKRYRDHLDFVRNYQETKGKELGYKNNPHQFPVMTRQETGLELPVVTGVRRISACHYHADHRVDPGVLTDGFTPSSKSTPAQSQQLPLLLLDDA